MSIQTDPFTFAGAMRDHWVHVGQNYCTADTVVITKDPMHSIERADKVWFNIVPPDRLQIDEASQIGGGNQNTELVGLYSVVTHLASNIDLAGQALQAFTKHEDNVFYYVWKTIAGFGSRHILSGVSTGSPLTSEYLRPIEISILDWQRNKIAVDARFEARFSGDLGA